MTKYLIGIIAVLILGMVIGFIFGVNYMMRHAADGVCIRADDGEAYLRVSEDGQRKLLEPSTRLLHIRVVNISTRNKQTL